jgi:hypothetical protein
MKTTQNNKNVALVELGGSHTECMHLQIKALKESGYNVFLICNSSLFDNFPDKTVFNAYQLHQIDNLVKSQIKTIRKVKLFLKKNNINTVVFNTTEINIIRNLLIFSFSKRNYIGIVHNGKYLTNSTSYKIISKKVKKILVLNDIIKDNLDFKSKVQIKVGVFYPIYYPAYREADIPLKRRDEIWIILPGAMSPKNKDLGLLLSSIENNPLNKSIHLILLGAIPEEMFPELVSRISYLSQSNNITMFNSHIQNEVFHTYLKHADMIMPLIQPENYGTHRISGSYNLAYGYNVPLYVEQNLKNWSCFKDIALSYDKSQNIAVQINALIENIDKIKQCKENLLTHPIYNVETQCRQFIDFIKLD